MLSAKNVCKVLDGKTILDNVNIEIMPGEVTLLTGPSGGGKSTLLRCLALLDSPDSGEVMVDGRAINLSKNIDKLSVHPKVTCVFQQLYLWPHLTNRQNIMMALNSASYKNELIESYIDKLDLAKCIDNFPNQSSLGQKQRVAILRALVLAPTYLLLDEITSALDTVSSGVVVDLLKSLAEEGKGILIVSHDFRLIRENWSKTYSLENALLNLVSVGR